MFPKSFHNNVTFSKKAIWKKSPHHTICLFNYFTLYCISMNSVQNIPCSCLSLIHPTCMSIIAFFILIWLHFNLHFTHPDNVIIPLISELFKFHITPDQFTMRCHFLFVEYQRNPTWGHLAAKTYFQLEKLLGFSLEMNSPRTQCHKDFSPCRV